VGRLLSGGCGQLIGKWMEKTTLESRDKTWINSLVDDGGGADLVDDLLLMWLDLTNVI